MKPARLTLQAEADLEQLAEDLAGHSGPAFAEGAVRSIRLAVRSLSSDPGSGHLREELAPASSGIRVQSVGQRWLLIHRNEEAELVIVRILDGRRDIAGLLRLDR